MATSLKQLQAIIGFTDTDLNANRRGKLSKTQIETLRARAAQELKVLLFIPSLVCFWILISVRITIAFPVLLFLSAMIAGIIGLHRLHMDALKDKKVRKLSGYLNKNPDRDYQLVQCVISIGDEMLPVDRDLYDQLPEGKFTLYLLDESNEILCMEPFRQVQKAKPKTATTSRSKKKSTTSTARQRTTRSQPKKEKQAKPKGTARNMPLTRTRTR